MAEPTYSATRTPLKWSSKLRSFEMESKFSPLEGYQLHIGLTKRETRFAESKLERASTQKLEILKKNKINVFNYKN